MLGLFLPLDELARRLDADQQLTFGEAGGSPASQAARTSSSTTAAPSRLVPCLRYREQASLYSVVFLAPTGAPLAMTFSASMPPPDELPPSPCGRPVAGAVAIHSPNHGGAHGSQHGQPDSRRYGTGTSPGGWPSWSSLGTRK